MKQVLKNLFAKIVCGSVLALCMVPANAATIVLADTVVSLPAATTLKKLARHLYPDDKIAQETYIAAVARVNLPIFSGVAQPATLKLAAHTRILLPAGSMVPLPLVQLGKNAATSITDKNGAALGPVATAAAQRGTKSCLSRIEQVSSALTQRNRAGTFLFNSLDDPDASIFSASMEIADAAGTVYASGTYAPTGKDGCQAVVEQVKWWPAQCADVILKSFAQYRVVGSLMKDIRIVEGDRRVRIFFMQTGGGCVSIKKEAIF